MEDASKILESLFDKIKENPDYLDVQKKISEAAEILRKDRIISLEDFLRRTSVF